MRDNMLDALRPIILSHFPEWRDFSFTLLNQGWDNAAVDIDGQWICRFPRDKEGDTALRREAALLAAIRPHVTLPVPSLILHETPRLFSIHDKIPGEHLPPDTYAALPETARHRLAEALAGFYAELHAIPADLMRQAGATPVEPWLSPEDILRHAGPVLSTELRCYMTRTITAWNDLPADAYGGIYGFFDGHGWNMAFDFRSNELRGIYDFADSGFGPLHQDLSYPNFISPELTLRIIKRYETLTGRSIDRDRVMLLHGVQLLSELAEYADDEKLMPSMRQHVADWAASGM